jgi:protein phosphatase
MSKRVLTVKSATDVGLKRSCNEDSFASWIPEDPREREKKGVLLVVADGMGGMNAGEVASRIAVEAVVRSYQNTSGDAALPNLENAVRAANAAVYLEAASDPMRHGMGTTCTAVVLHGRNVCVAHVGDSRAYLIRRGEVRQLTRDHSLVAELVQQERLTVEQARVDPRRNVITRCLGMNVDVPIDAECVVTDLAPGDTVVVCSDGLHGTVTDAQLADVISRFHLDRACRDLIAMARERGGPDNITVVLARLEELDDTKEIPSGVNQFVQTDVQEHARAHPVTSDGAAIVPTPPQRHSARRRSTRTIWFRLVLLAAVIVALVVLAAWIVMRLRHEVAHLKTAADVEPRRTERTT